MLPNPIIPSKTSKAVAVFSIILSAGWTIVCCHELFIQHQEGSLNWFASFVVTFAFLGILGIQMALNLYKRPMFDNFRYCISFLSYLITFFGISWVSDVNEWNTGFFLPIFTGSVLYYAVTRLLSSAANFPVRPLHIYFSNSLPAVLTFFFWVDSYALANHLDSGRNYSTLTFLGSIALSVGFYMLSAHFLKTPKEKECSAKAPLTKEA